MRSSIKWKLVAIYILLVFIVMIITGTLIVMRTSSNAYQYIENGMVRSISLHLELINDEDTIESIDDKLQQIVNAYKHDEKKLFLLNSDGTIRYASDRVKDDRFYTPMVIASLNNRVINQLDTVILYAGGVRKEYRGYAKPVLYQNEVVFVIYMLASVEQVKKNIESSVEVILLAVLLAIILSVVLGFVFSNFLTKPIIALTNKAREMSEGYLDNPIEVHSSDEIGELAQNFNLMSKALNYTLSEISSEKNKLETVFTHMTDGLLVFDTDGIIIHKNLASSQLLDTANASSFEDIFDKYLDITFEELLNYTNSDITQHVIGIDDKYVNICFAPFLDLKNSIMGNICVIQDITEYKKLEEMQKEFVANVSHELRTPLTTIKSYAETLLDGALDDKEIAIRFLNVINNEGDRMTALVQDLLELSMLDNEQTKFAMQQFNLTYILEDSINKYKIHADKKNQILNYKMPNKIYKIIGDPNRIEQVIKNIISNAVKYSLEGAQINVSIYEEMKYIVILIKDTGLGISKKDLPRIFERFYRVDKARSREMGGTGLGLAIAKEIMEYHGGKIEVKSGVGVGSSFYLYFLKE